MRKGKCAAAIATPLIVILLGLTSYGDNEFSLFLRKAFIKGAGYTDEALDRKIVGIIDTGVIATFPL